MEKLLNRLQQYQFLVHLGFVLVLLAGIMVAPFMWNIPFLDRQPVPVDAIPDIGENQQIVFTQWPGRSPQDIDDQITYPLTVALLGIPQVKTVRSYSMFGFSSIYVIFKEEADFYWSRSRILEKLNALPSRTLPEAVQPTLGPDATALGQVFWYTLEGRDGENKPSPGWDPQELRSIQDWYVRYGLMSAEGVAEVASVGGALQEYQIDLDPAALREYDVSLQEVFQAVRNSNVDVGARTVEVNRVEYVVRGLGSISTLEDIENIAVKTTDHVPLYLGDVGVVTRGPAMRRGTLDREGAEAVGGVVVARFGENPLQVIDNVKTKIVELSPGLPIKILEDGRESQVTIVPFYDRTGLIKETLGTLSLSLENEVLITIVVVLIMIMNVRVSLLISALLPLTILLTFIGMKGFGVDANIVALSGIAIAIGTIVDVGIVVSENMVRHLKEAKGLVQRQQALIKGVAEVGSAVLTAVATTVVSFLPVFAMEGAEGKLFRPLAYTKTFALVMSLLVALVLLPIWGQLLFIRLNRPIFRRWIFPLSIFLVGLTVWIIGNWWLGLPLLLVGFLRTPIGNLRRIVGPQRFLISALLIFWVVLILTRHWLPLGYDRGLLANLILVVLLLVIILGGLLLFTRNYPRLLTWSLDNKLLALVLPALLVWFALLIWLGFGKLTFFWPQQLKSNSLYSGMLHRFPGLGREFMPPLEEGSFLYMPTTMPHAGMEESLDALRKVDLALYSVSEVEMVVGKLGRADTPLDPAPISMIETVVQYKTEFILNENGRPIRFKIDSDGEYVRDATGELIQDSKGKPYRQWRNHIHNPRDIWDELVAAARIPGTTSAPFLQPISARLVMLQSGMRAPMGIKVHGPDLPTIEAFALELEKRMKKMPGIRPETVLADRVVGKPYLEIELDRRKLARYGLSIMQVQNIIEVAIGGKELTTTVEGRERYPVRVRFMRDFRGDPEQISRLPIPAAGGIQIPLGQVAEIHHVRGPQVIKSEDTFLTAYVLFDKLAELSEVDVVETAQRTLDDLVDSGQLIIPSGVSYSFAGTYQQQIRAARKLRLLVPLALLVIIGILYTQFRRLGVALIVFSGVFVAWSGGFLLIWMYGQDWFLNISFLDTALRDLFQIHPINLSVAVWVGFLALFGIATDDGVLISTYIRQSLKEQKPRTVKDVRNAVVIAGSRRIRPAMMTTATTLLALLPVLTSQGRGADVMIPMAIPSFGGMLVAVLTTFVVPILYASMEERQIKRNLILPKSDNFYT